MKMDLQILSHALSQAESLKQPVEPLSSDYPWLTAADAYKIQFFNISQRRMHGQSVVGYKIGLTGKSAQNKFQTNEPDLGHLMNNMRIPENSPCFINTLISPKIECEIAFSVKKPLKGPNVSSEDVLDATEYIAPSFEIIDSRIKNWQNKLADTIADNGSAGRFYIGQNHFDVYNFDLSNMNIVLYKNNEFAGKGNSSEVCGSPVNAVAWLANRLAACDRGLESGDIVLSGAFFPPLPVTSGDVFTASFDGLNEISLSFSE